MKAMIFAAGLGTRLKPLTDTMPKAMVPVAGKPLLQHVIEKLIHFGFEEIIVNVHHFPDQIIDYLRLNNNFGIRIEVSDERDFLLDTGGGIRKAATFFDDNKPFLVHNVDILSNVDLTKLYSSHLTSDALATLVVSKRDTYRYLLFDRQLNLRGWINEKSGETKPVGFSNSPDFNKLAFSGIQILSPEVFDLMQKYETKFPIMDFYLENAQTKCVRGFVPEEFRMIDVGKLNVLDDAEKFLK
jgi:NDP-sugar pyrophosphorylase family protein